MRARVAGIGMAAVLVGCAGAGAAVRYVDDSAPAGGNGQTWTTAYNSLSAALAASVAGDEIRVGQGTYKPGAARTNVFLMKDGVAVRGGYAGYAAVNPNARSSTQYPSVLSGDLSGNDGANFTSISDNSFQVVSAPSTVSGSAVLEGFTIIGGNGDGAFGSQDRGAGLSVSGSPQIIDCTFRNNSASGGAAINVGSSANPSIKFCTFVGNRATGATAFANGGAIQIGGNAEIACCYFAGNSASAGNGGAVSVVTSATQTKVHNSIFSANSAANGGALNLGPSQVVNCTFAYNSASSAGGAINVAPTNSPVITNCILWESSAIVGGREINGSAIVSYSCVKGGASGTANFDADPLFVDPAGPDHLLGTADDDLRLRSGPLTYSPCIDAGNSVPQMALATTDLAGSPRFADHPYVQNLGSGPGDPVDIGAYESKPIVCSVDFNADGDVNADDLGDFINAYFTGCQ